jgi:hypothetical protein
VGAFQPLKETRVKRALTPSIALAIFALNVYLNWPLFLPGELPFRGSIEGGYAGMARFVSAHPDPWGWNPLQYCGLPTQFMYVPGLPYLTAFVVRLVPSLSPEYAYRLLTALVACLGPVTLFLFALYFTRSPKKPRPSGSGVFAHTYRWAAAAAIAYTLYSPSYGMFSQVEKDRGIVQLPWRIQLLAKYGEGPHNTGLMLLPLALLAVWIAGKRGGYPRIFTAAILLAMIPLINWVSAFALALACLLLMLAAWSEPGFRTWHPMAAAGLAYLFACFWLTPSFIQTIVFNWPADSFGYQFREPQKWLLVGLLLGLLVIRLAFLKLRGSFYFCFVTLCAFTFGWFTTGFYVYHYDTIPESRRYALEFELFLALALTEAARLAWRSKNQTARMSVLGSAAVLLFMAGPQVWWYTTQGWSAWTPAPPETTVEYRIARWLADRHPTGRIFASGGLRFRLNSWFPIAQVGGGFETGLHNRMPIDLAYHVRTGRDLRGPQDMMAELRALGTEYVVVHGPKSKEYYRDYLHPEWLAASMPPVWKEGDDAIYQLPVRPLANLVSPEALPGKDAATHPWVLDGYLAALENAPVPARWLDTNTLAMDAAVPPGKLISVRVNADPGWQALQDGREIRIETDHLGFMALHPSPAGIAHIELRYRGTGEQRIMAAVSAAAWLAALFWLLVLGKKVTWRKRSGLMKTN